MSKLKEKIEFLDSLEKKELIELIRNLSIKSFENAHELMLESKILSEHTKYHRAFFLAQIASEEIGKHIICVSALVRIFNNDFTVQKFIKRFNDHIEKQIMINLHEDAVNLNIDSILNLEFLQSAATFDQVKMISLYTDYFGSTAFKPSDIDLKEICTGAIGLLEKRIEHIIETGIMIKLAEGIDDNILHQISNKLNNYNC